MSEALIALPLEIEVRGEVITSNAAAFREWVRESIARINLELTTDKEFAQAENDAKGLKEAEGALKAAKEKALRDAEQLHALFTELDETSEELREARLKLERQIRDKKLEVRAGLIDEALARLPVDFEIAVVTFCDSFCDVVKGKRTLASMRKALKVAELSAKGMIEQSQAILDRHAAEHGPDLIMDRRELEVKRPDQVEAELRRRLDLKRSEDDRRKAEEEARIARAEADELKRQEAEKSKPPEPVETPVVDGDLSTDEEWQIFDAVVRHAFGEVKAARGCLHHPRNVERAGRFAIRLNALWKEVAK